MKRTIVYFIAATLIIASCKSFNNTQKGTAIGAGTGAAAGAIIAGKNNTALGAIIGAAIGGTGGFLIGNKMDKQAKAIKQAIPDADVQRVGEGINVTFNSSLLFKINSILLSDSAMAGLDKIAQVFTDYPETDILVEGHTDDTGTDQYNIGLSEQRAKTVAAYLESKGVQNKRFSIKWYGKTQPKYPNNSAENRALNRRVELAIVANNDMKQDAEKGKIDTTGVR